VAYNNFFVSIGRNLFYYNIIFFSEVRYPPIGGNRRLRGVLQYDKREYYRERYHHAQQPRTRYVIILLYSVDIIAPMSVQRKKNNETKRQNEKKIEGHIGNYITASAYIML